MIWIVTSSLIGHRVISRFCAPASMKPRRSPMTPSPALDSPEAVSQAERVTNQVPLRSRVLTSSAVRIPSSSMGDASPLFQAAIVVLAPANAKPLRCIGFLKNLDLVRSDLTPGASDSFGFVSEEESSGSKKPWVAKCRMWGPCSSESACLVTFAPVNDLAGQSHPLN